MKDAWLAGLLLTLLLGVMPARGADDPRLENLALCRDSWLEWKTSDPAKLNSVAAYFRFAFTHTGNDAFATPNAPTTLGSLKVTRIFPDSVGMGVGFSAQVDATFDEARKAIEQRLGKPLSQCEASDGMRSCGLPIAAQRTLVVMSGDPPDDRVTLIGCYYLYEK